MKKLIIAAVMACGCAHFIFAEQVQSWFTGGANGTTPTATNGAWPTTLPTDVTVADSKFTFDLAYSSPLDFTPTAAAAPDTNVVTRMTVVAKFTPVIGAMPTFDTPTPKTALVVSNDAYYAYALVDSTMGWVKLVNDNVSVSEDAVTVLIEMDYKRSDVTYARYGIVSGETTYYLHTVGAEAGTWLTLATNSESDRLIAKVSFGGEGEVSSLTGNVQLGVASYAGVKYPTVQEAVNAAGTTENAKVTVLRDNSETITIAENQKIELDTNGKESGAIVNNSDTPVNVDVKIPETTVAEGSGTYSIEVAVSGDATVKTVTTSDTSKEAAGTIVERDGKKYLDVTVRTSAAIMNEVKFDGKAVADPANADYRAFLTNYCGEASGAYMKANTTASEITEQLGAEANNGLPLWESYVLALDPTDATSKPAAVVKPAAESSGGMILTVPTYKATLPTSNYTVQYKKVNVTESTSEVIDDPNAITIPFDGNQYRVDTVIVPNSAQ